MCVWVCECARFHVRVSARERAACFSLGPRESNMIPYSDPLLQPHNHMTLILQIPTGFADVRVEAEAWLQRAVRERERGGRG